MTLKQLAEELNLSVATVSQALKDEPGVHLSPQTRARVRAEARRVGYQANLQARHLVKQRAEGVVPIFCSDLPPIYAHLEKLRSLQQCLSDYGYQAAITVGKAATQEQTLNLLQSLCRQRPQGLVWLYVGWRREQEEELAATIARYVADGGMLVSLDDDVAKLGDRVFFDREHNTYLAAKHLLDLGHRRIGLFLGPGYQRPDEPRSRGVRRAFVEAEASLEGLHIFALDTWAGYESGCRLAEQFLQEEERPTGMVILNDQTALAFVTAVTAAGVSVPQELSVVGHDNEPWGAYLPIPLTTVTHPYHEVASAAASLIHDRLSGKETGPPRRVTILSELVVRASTAPAFP